MRALTYVAPEVYQERVMATLDPSGEFWKIRHRVTYEFEIQRETGSLDVLFEPPDLPQQKIHRHHLMSDPKISAAQIRVDDWGNRRLSWRISDPFQQISLEAETTVELVSPLAGSSVHERPSAAFTAAPPETTEKSSSFWAWSARYLPDHNVDERAIEALTRGFKRDFAYDPSATAVGTPLKDIFANCRGACQDFARLACAVLQARDTPARYVTGYALPSSNAAVVELHAWFEAWLPEKGWQSYDPVLPHARHIVLAYAPSQADAPIISGSCEGPPSRQRLTSRIFMEGLAIPMPLVESEQA